LKGEWNEREDPFSWPRLSGNNCGENGGTAKNGKRTSKEFWWRATRKAGAEATVSWGVKLVKGGGGRNPLTKERTLEYPGGNV